MKAKIFTVLAALAMTAMVSAQTFNRIVVNIEKGSESDELYLIESPSFTDDFENSYDEAKGFIGGSIYIYGTTAYGSQGMVCTNNLQGAFIGYRATADGTATITFSDLQSDLADVTTYYLYDTESGDYTAIGLGSSNKYIFSAVAGDHPNRFMIVEPVKVNTNEDGWASYAGKVAMAPTNGLKAFFAEYVSSSVTVNLNEVEMIPAAEGVFLYGAALTEYTLSPVVTGLTASGTNDLVGCVNYTDVSGETDAIYCLRNVGGESALYQYLGANIPAGKAYLPITVSGPSAAPKRISFRFNGTTDIDEVQSDNVQCTKFIENGQLLIKRGNAVYNLKGQMVR